MKIKYDLYSQAKISVSSRPRINANFPDQPILDERKNPVIDEEWLEVPFAVAKGLENLQNAITELEGRVKSLELEKGITPPAPVATGPKKYGTRKKKVPE